MVILDLTGQYRRQTFWKDTPACYCEIVKREGTCFFCSDEALPLLRKEISGLPLHDIHFIGSGDYHYLTLLFLERIQEPFILVQIDHHSDCRESAFGPGLLSCGSWVARARESLPLLRKIWLAGPGNEDGMREELSSDDTYLWIPEESLSSFSCRMQRQELPVYISLDKDVLSNEYAATDWSQGSLTADELIKFLKNIFSNCRVIGMDVCGEAAEHATDEEEARNDKMNQQLAGLWSTGLFEEKQKGTLRY